MCHVVQVYEVKGSVFVEARLSVFEARSRLRRSVLKKNSSESTCGKSRSSPTDNFGSSVVQFSSVQTGSDSA